MTLIKHTLKALSMGIDTHQEPVVYMRQDYHIIYRLPLRWQERAKC